MPDEDELIERSRAMRAQAETLIAWSATVRERSRIIVARGFHLPFDPSEEWNDDKWDDDVEAPSLRHGVERGRADRSAERPDLRSRSGR